MAVCGWALQAMKQGGDFSDLAERVPYPRSNVLPGVTRAVVVELAGRAGIEVRRAAVDVNQVLAAELTPSLMPLLCPGAVLAADPAIECRDLEPLPLPDGIAAGRYHLYRRL